MKKILFAVFALLSLTGFAKNITKPLTLSEYTAIDAQGAVTIVMNANIKEAYLEGPEKELNRIVCQVDKGTLHVYPRPDKSVEVNGHTVEYNNGMKISSRAKIKLYLPLNPNLRHIELEGATSFVADLQLPRLTIDAEGVSVVELTGSVADLHIDAEGVSKVKASRCKSVSVTVDMEGTSVAEVWATQRLTGSLEGVARLCYKGTPTITISREGVSRIEAL